MKFSRIQIYCFVLCLPVIFPSSAMATFECNPSEVTRSSVKLCLTYFEKGEAGCIAGCWLQNSPQMDSKQKPNIPRIIEFVDFCIIPKCANNNAAEDYKKCIEQAPWIPNNARCTNYVHLEGCWAQIKAACPAVN